MTPSVVIFRKRLLSYSETFIADQGLLLPGMQAVFCGFGEDTSGLAMIENAPHALLSEFSRTPALSKLALRMGLSANRRWLSAIEQYHPKLIHAHFFNDGIDALQLGRQLELPVITTVHGHDITKYENAKLAGGRTQRFFERVDRVIAVSKFIAEQALARGCPKTKLVQHYIGIDLEKFTQQKNETADPSLLFVGRLVEKKGCTYLLQAMEQLKPRFPELRLTIIGEGDLKPVLQQEASERKLNVEFAGTASAAEIRQQLARCWLFVAPSITAESGDAEGLGMVFLEAQALQTPVVSFRSGGLVEAVDEGRTALLSGEKDVAGLTQNIAQLLEDSSLRRKMGIAGRERVEKDFDVRRQCARLESIYAECS